MNYIKAKVPMNNVKHVNDVTGLFKIRFDQINIYVKYNPQSCKALFYFWSNYFNS